jgi:DNA-binding CsgD family transcriptional regulator/sugar-specific transcriptional regulator TrmB
MAAEPLLGIAGLSELDERIYLFVVHRGRTVPPDVAERFDLAPPEADARLEELRERGFLVKPGTFDGGYSAIDPRSSLVAVADGLSDRVRRIRELVPQLAEQFDRSEAMGPGSRETHVVTDPATVASWYVRLQHQATRELMVFDRPPYVSSPLEPLEVSIMGRGITWLAVYSSDSFTREGAWEEIQRLAEQGEQGRVVPRLPVKLAIADRRIALLSLSLDGVRSDALVTQAEPLVALLCDVFDTYWSRGLPLTESARGHELTHATAPDAETAPAVRVGSSSPRAATSEEQTILALIGSGLTDDAIAARLGMSVRSLRRRSQRLMDELGAENRFQAGVEAARRGWV